MEQAVKRLEQIRQVVAKKMIQFKKHEINTTISADLSTFTDKVNGEKVIECVEQKLYKAKKKEGTV